MATTVNVQLPKRENRSKRVSTKATKKTIKKEVQKDVRKQVRDMTTVHAERKVQREVAMRKGLVPVSRPGVKRAEDFSQIVKAITLPIDTAPVRFTSEFTTRPTSVAVPWAKANVTWPTSASSTYQDLPTKNEYGAFLFRDPLRAYISYNANPTGSNCTYRLTAIDNYGSTALNFNFTNNETMYVAGPATLVGGIAFHGQYLYPGTDANVPGSFFWVDDAAVGTSSVQYVQNEAMPANQTLEVRLYKWSPKGLQNVTFLSLQNTTSGQVNSLATSGSGYYGISFKYSLTNGAFTGRIDLKTTSSSVWEHHCLPYFENNYASVSAMRVNAASIMYTNMAAEMYREGKIAAIQSPLTTPWYSWWKNTTGFTTSVQGGEGGELFEADNGIYGFLKPSQPDDFNITRPVIGDAINGYRMAFQLSHRNDYVVIAANISNTQNGGQGQDGYLTVAFQVEFETTDVWRTVGKSRFSAESFRKGLNFVKDVPQFHENPLHIGEIIRKVAQGVVKYAPRVANIARAIAEI